MQKDPEVMREVEALMDDPEFQKVGGCLTRLDRGVGRWIGAVCLGLGRRSTCRRTDTPPPLPKQYMEEYMSSPEVQQSLKMAETVANDPEALGRFQQQLASALGAWPCLAWRSFGDF